MGKTIAEVLFEEGFAKGTLRTRRKLLVRLLRLRTEQVLAAIKA